MKTGRYSLYWATAACLLLLVSSAGAQEALAPATAVEQKPVVSIQPQMSGNGTLPDSAVLQQRMRNRMDAILGMNINVPTDPSGFPVDAAMSSIKLDPAVQAAINEKLVKIMNQTIEDTFSDARMMQEIQQSFKRMSSVQASDGTKNQPSK